MPIEFQDTPAGELLAAIDRFSARLAEYDGTISQPLREAADDLARLTRRGNQGDRLAPSLDLQWVRLRTAKRFGLDWRGNLVSCLARFRALVASGEYQRILADGDRTDRHLIADKLDPERTPYAPIGVLRWSGSPMTR